MKNQLFALLIVFLVFFLIWYTAYYAQINVPSDTSQQVKNSGIKQLKFDIDDDSILISVSLDKPATCEEVISKLGITRFSSVGRDYKPVCNRTSDTHMKIVYTGTKSP